MAQLTSSLVAPTPGDLPPLDSRVIRSRAAILRAAAELLIEGGASGVTIDGVAERSGVAKTTIYRHWKSRPQLIFDAFEELLSGPHATPPPGPVRERLVALLRGLARGITDSPWAPAVAPLIDAGDRDPELRQLIHDFLARRMAPAKDLLREAVAAAEIDADMDLDIAVSTLAGPIFYRRLVSREPLTDAFIESVVDQFLRAVRP